MTAVPVAAAPSVSSIQRGRDAAGQALRDLHRAVVPANLLADAMAKLRGDRVAEREFMSVVQKALCGALR